MGTDLSDRGLSAVPVRRAARCAPFALVALLAVCPASAQSEPSAAQIAAAREVGIEGLRLADEGRCGEAIGKLEQAEKLYSAPTTLTRLGECRVREGKLVAGTENLQRVARMSLSTSSPPAFRAAQERAQKVLAEALPRLARLRVTVTAAAGVTPLVKLDGEPVPAALLGVDMPADPGAHRLELTAAGFLTETRSVTLAEQGRESVTVTLRPDPKAPVAPAATASNPGTSPTAPPTAPAAPASSTQRYAAYGLLGVGAAGLIVGGVFGILATSRKGDLDDQCTNKLCPLKADSDYERARSAGLVSTLGFGVGVVGAGVGLVLLLTGGSSPASARATRGLTVGAGPSPAGLGLRGAF